MYVGLILLFANCGLGFSFDYDRRENFSSKFGFAKYNSSKRHKEDVPERSLLAFNKLYHPLEPYCTKPAKCEPLRYHTCMGTKLPYSHTTLDLVDDLASQEQAQEQLEEWRKIIHIPKCWAVVQPFLCSLFMPRCEDGEVYLPSMEMCNVTLGPCRVLVTYENWPSVFMCKNESRYRTKCKNDFRELKFNTTGKCLEPLVQTELPAYHYEGVEGCGIQCDDPMFTAHQRDQIHKMVAWAATSCALNNLFAVLTFMIDWRFSNKYPALAIFYINLCFFIVCLGWLAQFMPGGREDIVCRKDGTLRLAEPSAGENLSCVVVYVMVYYFLMAGILWFVILTYAWNLSLQALGKIQERIDKKGAYFHMVAWSLPLVLTITTMALGEIDGNSVTGICFVGNANSEYRAGFLLLPIAAALITGTYFLLKGLYTLIRLKLESEEIISQRASAKIKETILRVGIFSVLVITFGATTFICHLYEFRNQDLWAKSFRTYILCRLGIRSGDESHEECRMSSRPSLAMLQLHILSLFVTGILMSTWVWTQNTLNTWTRYLAKVFNRKIESAAQVQAKPQKHKLIAQAYSKRKLGMNEDGVCLSLNLDVSHEDPVGLGIELYSGHSGSVRSSWAAALPKLMTRRDAFVPHTNSSSSIRRNSVDSQISYSVRRVSVESRRHSVDSEVSVKVSEVTQTVVKKVSTPLHKHRMHRGGRGSRKYPKYKSKRSSKHNRNSASASSNDSNIAFQQLMLALADSGGAGTSSQSNLKAFGFNGVSRPKLGRRKANAGLENINSLALLADKLMKHRKSTSSSSSDKTAKSSHPNLDILKDIYGESDMNKSRRKSDQSD